MSGSGFKVKVKMNSITKILKAHGLDKDGRVQRFVRDDAERLMAPYVPGGSEGKLVKNRIYPSNRSIKYTSPYAHYMYYGKLMLAKNGSSWAKFGESKHYVSKNLKYHTSGTGPKWDKLMLQRRGKELEKDVQNYIKSGGNQ